MYKRILLPIDGSECSKVALEHGLQLAKTFGAEVVLLHSVENPLTLYAVPETIAYNKELFDTLKETGKKTLESAKTLADHQGVKATTNLVENARPLEAILEHLKTCDLVVMGTHGRRGFERWMLGSVAEGVLRHADKPCLMIRHTDKKS
ncbi:MAG: universal stress protein [Trueperaceae bacterium]